MSAPSPTVEAPLEHFELIEDVVAHIRTKLPAESGPESWKNVCEDVLHCHLPQVEPLLLKELEAVKGNSTEEEQIRGLLRAVSWYNHPPKTTEQILRDLGHLRPTHPKQEDQTLLDTVQSALEKGLDGKDALPAAEAIDALFARATHEDHRVTLRTVRDQLYYQLLYPHWFEVVKRWADARKTA